MKKFNIEAAGTDGIGRSFIINQLNKEQYQIFNEQQERLATIEIDDQDPGYCRQSLDCKIDLTLIKAIRHGILYHDGPL
ncbi:hypothetical protein [Pedobacter nyackensis]|uniref:hypothetical protein n=1 Tax=Pedobacter nyackensis TaxID=475255 RepID=UPI002930A443|nr:hypothetical protein [Pedobacter nyackensis]